MTDIQIIDGHPWVFHSSDQNEHLLPMAKYILSLPLKKAMSIFATNVTSRLNYLGS